MEELPEDVFPETPPAVAAAASSTNSVLSMLGNVAISIVLAVVVIVFIYQPVKVEGTSMMPGLTDQERIFINKYTYRLGSDSIEREDLVVFHYPYDPSQSYIKRVIGLPGDAVEMRDGTVYVNGKKLDEPYVPDEYRDHLPAEQKWTVPASKYFVLGDHRSSSNDSRAWGYVDRKEIYGKAVFVYWPLDRMGPVR
jgi:signal peptidase I